MKTFKVKSGPFAEQPYYTSDDVDTICTDELQSLGLEAAEQQ